MTALLWKTLRDDGATPDHILNYFKIIIPPVPVEDLANKLGVSVHKASNAGWLAALDSRGALPYLWTCVPPERKNYAIAHELGHLFLHPPDLYRDLTFHDGKQDEEAHTFAIKLLLPEQMLRTAARFYINDTEKLAPLFEVPEHLLRIRLAYILGL